jgi:VPS62-like protein
MTEQVAAPAAEPRRRGLFRRYADAPWWLHTIGGVVLAVLAVFSVAVVLAFLYVDYSWETTSAVTSGTPPQTAVTGTEAADLARKFAPILRYDTQERFVPISRAAYLSRTDLSEQPIKRALTLLASAPTVGSLPTVRPSSCPPGCFLFLDVRSAEPKPGHSSAAAYDRIENKLLRDGAKPTVYYHVSRYTDTDETAVQYWFLYFFNYRLNEHESDWEQITVRVDENGKPIGAFYSAHEGGNIADWDKIRSQGDHPIVYPARGSHANYFKPGKPRVTVVCKRVVGVLKQCVKGRAVRDLADGKGRELTASDYRLAAMTGPLFVGSYGSGNYVVLTRKADVLRDPRVRGAWKDALKGFR